MTANVLVGWDGTSSSRAAVAWAATEASRRAGRLTVLAVVDQAALAECRAAHLVQQWRAARRRSGELAVEGAAVAEAAAPGLDVVMVPAVGAPSALLVSASRHADLLVLGRGEAGGGRLPRPSVQGIARLAHCPVVLIGAEAAVHPGPQRPVVVGVDGSRRALRAVEFAAAAAAAACAPLHVLAVWTPRAALGRSAHDEAADRVAERVASAAAARAADRAHVLEPALEVQCSTAAGDPPVALTRAGRQAGLLVVGRRGQGAVGSLDFGAVSRGVMRAGPCPVAVVGLLAAPGGGSDPVGSAADTPVPAG